MYVVRRYHFWRRKKCTKFVVQGHCDQFFKQISEYATVDAENNLGKAGVRYRCAKSKLQQELSKLSKGGTDWMSPFLLPNDLWEEKAVGPRRQARGAWLGAEARHTRDVFVVAMQSGTYLLHESDFMFIGPNRSDIQG